MVYLNKCKYVCGYVVLNNASSDRVGLWEQFFMWNPMTFLSYKFNVQNLALPLIKFCVAVYAVALFQYISDVCNDKFTFKLIYVLKIINLFWFFFWFLHYWDVQKSVVYYASIERKQELYAWNCEYI